MNGRTEQLHHLVDGQIAKLFRRFSHHRNPHADELISLAVLAGSRFEITGSKSGILRIAERTYCLLGGFGGELVHAQRVGQVFSTCPVLYIPDLALIQKLDRLKNLSYAHLFRDLRPQALQNVERLGGVRGATGSTNECAGFM